MTYSERLTPLPAMDLWSRLIDGVTWNEDELEVAFVTGNVIQSQQYPILGTRYTGPTEYRIASVVLGVSYTLAATVFADSGPPAHLQCEVTIDEHSDGRILRTDITGPLDLTVRDNRMLLRVMSGIRDVSVNRAIRPPTLGI